MFIDSLFISFVYCPPVNVKSHHFEIVPLESCHGCIALTSAASVVPATKSWAAVEASIYVVLQTFKNKLFYCFRRRALVSVAFVVGLSFSLNISCYWMRYCERPSLLVWSGSYYYISWHWTAINVIVINLLPLGLLLLFNYLVLSQMIRIRRSRHHMTSTERMDYRTARMMMAIVIGMSNYKLSIITHFVYLF